MKTIKIGNDIKILFKIKEIGDFDSVNIKKFQVFLINTESEPVCVKRFPKEPFPQYYIPTEYTLRSRECYQYNAMPCYSKCEYARFPCGYHNYHLWDKYNGFGVKSKRFCECCDSTTPKDSWYLTFSTIEEGKNEVSSYFQSQVQRKGIYKMIVVMTVYEDGWGKNNLHTFILDYGLIFTIDDIGEDGTVIVDLRDNKAPANTYIGFSAADSPESVNLSDFKKTSNVYGEYSIVNNTGDWAYLWIFTDSPINKITTSGFEQPIDSIQGFTYQYCYRSHQKLDRTSYNFKIE